MILVWLNRDHPWQHRVKHHSLPLSTPLSFRWSTLWCCGPSLNRKFLQPRRTYPSTTNRPAMMFTLPVSMVCGWIILDRFDRGVQQWLLTLCSWLNYMGQIRQRCATVTACILLLVELYWTDRTEVCNSDCLRSAPGWIILERYDRCATVTAYSWLNYIGQLWQRCATVTAYILLLVVLYWTDLTEVCKSDCLHSAPGWIILDRYGRGVQQWLLTFCSIIWKMMTGRGVL